MLKRLQNVKSTLTLKLSTPMHSQASVVKKRRLQFQQTDKEAESATGSIETTQMTDPPKSTCTDLDNNNTGKCTVSVSIALH